MLVNRYGRISQECFGLPPGIVVREAGMRLAVSLLYNRQRRYGYRLPAVSKIQPARSILPVTFTVEKDQVQPEKLPENNNDWGSPPATVDRKYSGSAWPEW